MPRSVDFSKAKTDRSVLVDKDEENVIAKGSLVRNPARLRRRKPAGCLEVGWIAGDFDAPSEDVDDLFSSSPRA